MEFKYRVVDDRPTPTETSYPPPPPPLPTITFFSDQPLRSGFSSMISSPIPNAFRMPVNNGNAGVALRRELEKAQIRREIIAGEVARRLELEEEVRRELAMERGWGIAMQRDLGAAMQRNSVAAPPPPPPPPPHHRFSFEKRVAMCLDPGVSPFESIFDVPKPQLPQLMAPLEIKPFEETSEDKVIILGKPNPDRRAGKRKAVTPLVVEGSEHLPFGLKKKPKEEWSCALCRVSATSERGLNEHLQGKRHRAKEASLRQHNIGKSTDASSSSKKRKMSVKSKAIDKTTSGLDAEADKQSFQPAITGGDTDQTVVDTGVVESKNEEHLVQNSQNIEGLKDENGTATANGHKAGRRNALKRKESKFWCEICQVGACSQVVMEGHMNGKKHLNRMRIFGPSNASSPLESSVSQEAPVLVKDTGTTDQKITDWGKFTVVEWPNRVENEDRVGEGL